MNLSELFGFIALLLLALVLSAWLNRLLGVPIWLSVLPIMAVCFGILRAIVTWLQTR